MIHVHVRKLFPERCDPKLLPGEDHAPLPLIDADLLMIGDARCMETTDLIHERILDGFVGRM